MTPTEAYEVLADPQAGNNRVGRALAALRKAGAPLPEAPPPNPEHAYDPEPVDVPRGFVQTLATFVAWIAGAAPYAGTPETERATRHAGHRDVDGADKNPGSRIPSGFDRKAVAR